MKTVRISSNYIELKNADTITVGQYFDSFRQFTNFLGLEYPATATKTKESLKKQLRQYWRWQELGQQIYITTVIPDHAFLETPGKPKETDAEIILPLLAAAMQQRTDTDGQEIYELIISNKQFYENILLCHPKLFNTAYTNSKWQEEFPELAQLEYANPCMLQVVNDNKEHAKNLLNRVRRFFMENISFARWSNTFMIQKEDGTLSLATEIEAVQCHEAILTTLKKLRCRSMWDVYQRGIYNEFTTIAYGYASNKFSIKSFKAVNHITTTKTNLQDFLNSVERELEDKKHRLNSKVVESLTKKMLKRNTVVEQTVPAGDVSTIAIQIALGFYTCPEFQYKCSDLHIAYRAM